MSSSKIPPPDAVKRHTHGNFLEVQASRPTYDVAPVFYTKSPNADNWKPGQGANDDEWKKHKKIDFDPYAEDRPSVNNYKLMVSAITPRPIAFISTLAADGKANLAPFSYFEVVCHDPITFTVGFSKGTGIEKDTAANLKATKEATINIISEWFIEAANFTCTNAPKDVSEWPLSGLTQAKSVKVKPAHVAESAFSVEVKVKQVIEFTSVKTGNPSGELFILEGIHVHAREDVVNADYSDASLAKLKPVARCGGITYTPVTQAFEIPRPSYKEEIEDKPEIRELLEK